MEYLGKLLTQQAYLRISWNALGCLVECSWQALGAPSKHGNLALKIAISEVLRAPRELKIAPQRLLGPFLDRLGLLKALGAFWGPISAPILAPFFGPKPDQSRSQLLFFGS